MVGDPYEGLTEKQIRSEASRIRDLVMFGFVGIIVELLEGTDAYGRPIVIGTESLWGIKWDVDDEYKAEVISGLCMELLAPKE